MVRTHERQTTLAKAESARLLKELATERAFLAGLLRQQDHGISAERVESARLARELATERALVARLFQERQELLAGSRQHVVLSSYLGDYTSEFLDAMCAPQRTALLGSIRCVTKFIWDSDEIPGCAWITNGLRKMMGEYGFVFREPGEGAVRWEGYAVNVPRVGAVEQLGRQVEAQREGLGGAEWYLLELTTVMLNVGRYLEANQ